MKICDRCSEKTVALILVDKKDGQEWDLCANCKEAFYIFMASAEVKIYDGSEDKNHKRGPRRPKKNGAK